MDRKPANQEIGEKKYSQRINVTMLTELGKGIHNHIVIARRFHDATYSAKRLAEDLKTNTRYISAAISYKYGCNYASLVNRLRIDEAKQMLENPDCTLNLDEIAYAVGFRNRQSFYTAFAKSCNEKPSKYRERFSRKAIATVDGDDDGFISFDI